VSTLGLASERTPFSEDSSSHATVPAVPGARVRLVELQRTIGNAAVARVLGQERRTLARACCSSCAQGHKCQSDADEEVEERGRRALSRAVAARQDASRGPIATQSTAAPKLMRYSHKDCTEDDLKKQIWPADWIARQMVKKAIKALSQKTIDPQVTALLKRFFMTETPSVGTILKVLDKVDVEFTDNDYTYECEYSCDSKEYAETTWGVVGSIVQAHIHLCMGKLKGFDDLNCTAATIVHEMTHRYASTWDHAYCNDCDDKSCPATLSADDALNNADSYFGLVYKLYPLNVITASADADPGDSPVAVASADGASDSQSGSETEAAAV
jgi:hypothetical protein